MNLALPDVSPEELAALRAQVQSLRSQADRQAREIRALESAVKVERLARERAEAKLKDLLRRLYGPKSEQLSADQLQLLFETLQADEQLRQDAPVASTIAAKQEKKPRKGGGRRAAPEHLPIERVEIDLPEAEKAGLVRIREEITEELDYQPSRFIRRHYVRFVYADPSKQAAPKLPQLPARVIPQAAVGVGLMVHLLVSKYVDHVPLYRQEQIAARVGVELSRQKLCRWVEEAALLLRAIYDRLREKILAGGYVQVDETPVKVLDPDRGGHAALAYLWTYLSPLSQAIVFDFDLSRGRGNLREFFAPEWEGVLQSDGYDAYDRFLRERPSIIHAGCMAHIFVAMWWKRWRQNSNLTLWPNCSATLRCYIGSRHRPKTRSYLLKNARCCVSVRAFRCSTGCINTLWSSPRPSYPRAPWAGPLPMRLTGGRHSHAMPSLEWATCS
jgi:transposase